MPRGRKPLSGQVIERRITQAQRDIDTIANKVGQILIKKVDTNAVAMESFLKTYYSRRLKVGEKSLIPGETEYIKHTNDISYRYMGKFKNKLHIQWEQDSIKLLKFFEGDLHGRELGGIKRALISIPNKSSQFNQQTNEVKNLLKSYRFDKVGVFAPQLIRLFTSQEFYRQMIEFVDNSSEFTRFDLKNKGKGKKSNAEIAKLTQDQLAQKKADRTQLAGLLDDIVSPLISIKASNILNNMKNNPEHVVDNDEWKEFTKFVQTLADKEKK